MDRLPGSTAAAVGGGSITPMPRIGEVFTDARGESRALRVSWHAEADLVVLSLWRDGVCAGTFRLAVEEVPGLIRLLADGLDHAYQTASDHLRDGDPPRSSQQTDSVVSPFARTAEPTARHVDCGD